eukprot:TRINITY_DN8005_c0_g1_i1.p1 TRINITY_DN8005_c0_g1~~TRINITY_DN8005_c0_g1_i1.p1  ORF type:complete len:113 (-),score=39.30 TRINITY_DN8005_c0_g1_i1:153-491(-)
MVNQTETEELACTYSALILHDSNLPITAQHISSLLSASGVKVASYWPKLFEQAFAKKSIGDFLVSAPSAGAPAAAAPAAASAPAAAAAKKEEPKKEEKKEESDEDMGFGLFD